MADLVDDETDDDFPDTQWTADARTALRQRAEELVAVLQEHVAATTQREGRAREDGAYWESAERLRDAMRAFTDSEVDWCGSSAFHIVEWEDDDEDDEWENDDEPGQILSVLTRSDYRIVDADAVVEAGRAAYLRIWPNDVEDDARVRVQSVPSAVGEVFHERGSSMNVELAGLELAQDLLVCMVHDGPVDDEWDDPFAIASGREPGSVG